MDLAYDRRVEEVAIEDVDGVLGVDSAGLEERKARLHDWHGGDVNEAVMQSPLLQNTPEANRVRRVWSRGDEQYWSYETVSLDMSL